MVLEIYNKGEGIRYIALNDVSPSTPFVPRFGGGDI